MQDLGLAGGSPTGAIQAIMGGGGAMVTSAQQTSECSMVLVRWTPPPSNGDYYG